MVSPAIFRWWRVSPGGNQREGSQRIHPPSEYANISGLEYFQRGVFSHSFERDSWRALIAWSRSRGAFLDVNKTTWTVLSTWFPDLLTFYTYSARFAAFPISPLLPRTLVSPPSPSPIFTFTGEWRAQVLAWKNTHVAWKRSSIDGRSPERDGGPQERTRVPGGLSRAHHTLRSTWLICRHAVPPRKRSVLPRRSFCRVRSARPSGCVLTDLSNGWGSHVSPTSRRYGRLACARPASCHSQARQSDRARRGRPALPKYGDGEVPPVCGHAQWHPRKNPTQGSDEADRDKCQSELRDPPHSAGLLL